MNTEKIKNMFFNTTKNIQKDLKNIRERIKPAEIPVEPVAIPVVKKRLLPTRVPTPEIDMEVLPEPEEVFELEEPEVVPEPVPEPVPEIIKTQKEKSFFTS